MAEMAPALDALPMPAKLIELRLKPIWLLAAESAPTCKVKAPETPQPVELGVAGDAGELGGQLADLLVDRDLIGGRERAVLRAARTSSRTRCRIECISL